MDDAGKIEHDGSSGITMDAESEIDPCKVDGTCPEVIKVYIFKADPGEDDLGHVTMKVLIGAFASLALLSEEQWLGSGLPFVLFSRQNILSGGAFFGVFTPFVSIANF